MKEFDKAYYFVDASVTNLEGQNNIKGGISALMGKPIQKMWMPEQERYAQILSGPRSALGLQWKPVEDETVAPEADTHEQPGF